MHSIYDSMNALECELNIFYKVGLLFAGFPLYGNFTGLVCSAYNS